MAAGYDQVATAIVRGQMKLMGDVALSLARKVADVTVADTGDTVVNGNAVIEGDMNGDGKADFAIKVDNVTKLTAADFVI